MLYIDKENINKTENSTHMKGVSSGQGIDKGDKVIIEFTPVKRGRVLPALLTFLLTSSAGIALGLHEGQSVEAPPIVSNYPLSYQQLEPLDEQITYTEITEKQIMDYAESYDETYLDTVIRYLGNHYEKLDSTRLAEMLEQVEKEYESKGYTVPISFLEGVATNRVYAETLHLATGNITYKTLNLEIDEKVPIYKSYFVLLKENASGELLNKLDKALTEESTPEQIEKRLKKENLWDSLEGGGKVLLNTPNYMEDSYTHIMLVDVGDTLVNHSHRYVAKLLSEGVVSKEALIKLYTDYLDYGSFRDVLNVYMEMIENPSKLDEDLEAILDKPTEAYKEFMATQSTK